MSVDILYRNDHFLVCSKPVGMLSESPGLPEAVSNQLSCNTLYPVHRLDQTTGGVIVLASSATACGKLQRVFQTDNVIKNYLAIAPAISGCDHGVMEDLLYHDKVKNKTYVVNHERKGVKKAVLSWESLQEAAYNNTRLNLLRISLSTGRTHQIRVQFASRGFPLVGDKKYGSRVDSAVIALWSEQICFQDPYTGDSVHISASPPQTFPWSLFSL